MGEVIMKNLLYILPFLFLTATNTAVAQEQTPPPADPIRLHDGIALEAPIGWWPWTYNWRFPGAIDSMRNKAGIDAVHLNIDYTDQVDTLAGVWGFNVMAGNMLGLDLNYVMHYTHAKYSVWEAEGDNDYIVNLVRNTAKTETDTYGDTIFIRRRGDVLNSVDELIWGPSPWYAQDVRYHGSQDGFCTVVDYTADFRLMIEPNPVDPPVEDNPEDTICVIQVTQSGGNPFCTYVIADSVIRLGDFELGQFKDFRLIYDLTSDSCQDTATTRPIPDSTDCGTILLRSGVEFKVIWMGKSNSSGYPAYLLSVDKVTLSEPRGQQMFVNDPVFVRQRIQQQAAAFSDYHHKIAGYIGPDEPRSIDLFEPMRKVTEILDDYTQRERPLWLFYAGGELYNQIFKNRVGRANISLSTFMFDLPCRPDISCDGCPGSTGDYRDRNIKWHSNNFKYAYELDPFYGINLQTGGSKPQYGDCSHQRNIARHELLYSANLAAMHGAKFLSFSVQGYFAQRPISDSLNPLGYSYHAIVDFDTTGGFQFFYTDKYYMVRDTLSPRLKGLFGKTIKKLIPGVDLLNINPSVGYDNVNINYLRKIELVREQGTEALDSYVDLRFFNNPAEYGDNYFMIINRWYSQPVYNRFRLKLKNLLGYNNWNLKNFMDSTNTTLLPDQNGDVTSPTDTILIGDAILYSLKPVVTDGGTLLKDEYAGEGMILFNDMIIDNGAVLSIYQNYTAKGNIIVEDGSIVNLGDGKINFVNGKKLIIRGNAIIEGTEEDKLTFDFVSPLNDNGIVIEEDATLVISNCIVKNAETGILAELDAYHLDARYVDFEDCENSSVSILGQSGKEQSSTPPRFW
jgi:hypothetical protein